MVRDYLPSAFSFYQLDFITIRVFDKRNHGAAAFHWPGFARHIVVTLVIAYGLGFM